MPAEPRRPAPGTWVLIGVATSAAAVLVWVGLGVAYWLAAGGDADRPVQGQQLWELAEGFLLGVMLAAPVIGAFTGWWQKRAEERSSPRPASPSDQPVVS